jgi:hypothetical protein
MLPLYFLKHYLQRGLYRAGTYGFSVALVSAYGRWLRDAKMYERRSAERASGGLAPGAGSWRVATSLKSTSTEP